MAITKTALKKMMTTERLSVREIAKKTGYTIGGIYYYQKKYNLSYGSYRIKCTNCGRVFLRKAKSFYRNRFNYCSQKCLDEMKHRTFKMRKLLKGWE